MKDDFEVPSPSVPDPAAYNPVYGSQHNSPGRSVGTLPCDQALTAHSVRDICEVGRQAGSGEAAGYDPTPSDAVPRLGGPHDSRGAECAAAGARFRGIGHL